MKLEQKERALELIRMWQANDIDRETLGDCMSAFLHELTIDAPVPSTNEQHEYKVIDVKLPDNVVMVRRLIGLRQANEIKTLLHRCRLAINDITPAQDVVYFWNSVVSQIHEGDSFRYAITKPEERGG